jgi:uncharacterized protein (DUF302 family)
MNKIRFTVHESKLGFEETVASLTATAEKNGWEIPMVHDLRKTYRDAGYEDMTQLKIIYFCNPRGGYNILKDDKNKPMSVMMPMGVSVYETSQGQVYIAGMALNRMSLMYDGTVKEVLQEGAVNFANTVRNISEPGTEGIEATELRKYGRRGCLGCVTLTVVLGALFALVAAIFVKVMPIVMPKMMARMMPKMMTEMERAGVQPPCAKIILDYLEAEK